MIDNQTEIFFKVLSRSSSSEVQAKVDLKSGNLFGTYAKSSEKLTFRTP